MKESKFNIETEINGNNVIYNTNTLAMIELDKNISEIHEKEELDILYENGFLVDDDIVETEFIINDFLNITTKNETLYLSIITTMDCNFECPYCFQNRKREYFTEETSKAVINFLELNKNKYKYVNVDWYGGEPLLNLELILKLSNNIKNICEQNKIFYTASLTSNGYLLDKKVAISLSKVGIKSCQVTIDGSEDVHNNRRKIKGGGSTYKEILENIINTKDIIDYSIRVNVDYSNIKSISSLLDDLKIKKLNDIPIYFKAVVSAEHNPVKEEIDSFSIGDILLDLNKMAFNKGFNIGVLDRFINHSDWFCIVDSINQYIVNTDGKLFKCGESFELDDIGYAGNLEKNGTISNYKNNWSKNLSEFKECLNCSILPICRGGCQMLRKHNRRPCMSDIKGYEEEYLKLYYKYLNLGEKNE